MSYFILNKDNSGVVTEDTLPSDTTINIHLISGQTAYFDAPIDSSEYILNIKYISNIPDAPDRNLVTVETNDSSYPAGVAKKNNPETIIVSGGTRVFFTGLRENIDSDILIFISLYKRSSLRSSEYSQTNTPLFIQINPPSYTLPLALQACPAFTAKGFYPDGTYTDITNQCTWSSSDQGVISTNLEYNICNITPVAIGTAIVTANYQVELKDTNRAELLSTTYLTAEAQVLVVSPGLAEITIIPSSTSPIYKGLTIQFTAMGTYEDGTSEELTNLVAWHSSDTGIATISQTGTLQSVDIGSTQITCTYNNITSNSITTSVQAAVFHSGCYIMPNAMNMALNTTFNCSGFAVYGTFTDGTVQRVYPANINWYPFDTNIITVSNGVVSAVGVGDTYLYCTVYSPSRRVFVWSLSTCIFVLRVTSPLTSITISPSAAQAVYDGLSLQFGAIGHYSDGSTTVLTNVVNWSSTLTSVATISQTGMLQSVIQGVTNISCTYLGITSNITQLTVLPPVIRSAFISPNATTVNKNSVITSLIAYGSLTDGAVEPVTPLAWHSSNASVVSVSGNTLTAVGVGIVNISFSIYSPYSQSNINSSVTSITVISLPSVLTSINISPSSSIAVYKGLTIQFTAIGTYADGTTQELTNIAVWNSSDTNKAVISQTGLLQSLTAGNLQISCSHDGITSNNAPVEVQNAVVKSAYINPVSLPANINSTINLAAYGLFTDGTISTVTPLTWQTDAPSIVSIVGNTITALSVGLANITFETYSPLYDGNYVRSAKSNVTVLNIPPDSVHYENYISNSQFAILNNNIIPGKSYNVANALLSTNIFYITGDPLGNTSEYGNMRYYIINNTYGFKDSITIEVISYLGAVNPNNAPHFFSVYLKNNSVISNEPRIFEAIIGDCLTLSGKSATFSMRGMTDNPGSCVIDIYCKQYFNSSNSVITKLGSIIPSGTIQEYSVSANIPIATYPYPSEDDNYFSISMYIKNTSSDGRTVLFKFTDISLIQYPQVLAYEYKDLANVQSYSNSLTLPKINNVKNLMILNNNVLEQDGNCLTINRNINKYGMSYLDYLPAVPPMTIALWLSPSTTYYPIVNPPNNWLKCSVEGTGSRPDYSSTKYYRLAKAFFDAGLIALVLPYDQIAGLSVTTNTVILAFYTSGGYQPFATITSLPTFSTTHTTNRVTIVCGSADDIVSSNNQGYILLSSTLNLKWYFIFVVDGVIIYPDAVTEREKIVYINIQSGYTPSQVASAIFSACRPFWNGSTGGYMSFSLPLTPSNWFFDGLDYIIKT